MVSGKEIRIIIIFIKPNDSGMQRIDLLRNLQKKSKPEFE